MNGASYEYAPGGALAVCGPRLAALVDLPPEAGLVPGLFELINSPAGDLDEVLELLVTPGLRAITHFALAERTDEGLRVLVRGRYLVQAGSQTLAGHGLWTDRIVQSDAFTLLDPDQDDPAVTLPLPGGVVLASRLRSVGRPAGGGSAAGTADGSMLSSEPGPSASSAPSTASSMVAAEDVPALAGDVPEPDDRPRPDAAPQASPAAHPPVAPAPALAGLAGAHPPVVSAVAPSRGAAASTSDQGGTGHTLPTPFTSPLTDLPSPTESPSAPVEQPTFIESLPWSTDDDREAMAAAAPTAEVPLARSPSAAPPSTAPADQTISRDALSGEGVQTVVAARCPSGHQSPAYAGTCRVCGQPLPPQHPVEIPRPPLGVLRLSNGDTVLLDRGCIMGRNPRVPSPYVGERPNLVTLFDPEKDISGQHLEVRLEYWHVAVKDLGSTNGTQVVLPGENPITLRPNDPMMIEPGTKVILAGVFSFVFEVTP